jgi:hypothetical protein
MCSVPQVTTVKCKEDRAALLDVGETFPEPMNISKGTVHHRLTKAAHQAGLGKRRGGGSASPKARLHPAIRAGRVHVRVGRYVRSGSGCRSVGLQVRLRPVRLAW